MSAYDAIGLASMVNRDNINPNLDLNRIERGYADGEFSGARSYVDPPSTDALDEYEAELMSDGGNSSGEEFDEETPNYDDSIDEDINVGTPIPFLAGNHNDFDRRSIHRRVIDELDEKETEFINNKRIEEEEEKSNLLGRIEDLHRELKDLKISTAHIPAVNISSSYSNVQSVHANLTRLYNKVRSCELGNEIFVSFITLIAGVFNGERSFMGFKPDLSGWDRSIRTKLPKMRYEISNTTTAAMDFLGLGSGGRILLDLIPSAIICHNTNKTNKDSDEQNYIPSTQIKKSNPNTRGMTLSDLEGFE